MLRPDKHYSKLSDVTDICGLRVITYFADDVEKVYQIIKRELKTREPNNKADNLKKNNLDTCHFTALRVCHLNASKLPLYKQFNGLEAEIQIRSILQHAWAEIEHDLGYKTVNVVPEQAQRRFSRLAGLLELGDDEFERIRSQLEAYDREITRGKKPIPVDKNSLTALLSAPRSLLALTRLFSNKAKLRVVFSDTFVETYVPTRFAYVDITTVQQIDKLIRRKEKLVTRFLIAWFLGPGSGRMTLLPKGSRSLFLCWALAITRKAVFPSLAAFVRKHAFNRHQDLAKVAFDLKSSYDEAQKGLVAVASRLSFTCTSPHALSRLDHSMFLRRAQAILEALRRRSSPSPMSGRRVRVSADQSDRPLPDV